MRELAPEADALRLGCGWTLADLGKPQILVESVAGESHPNSVHLNDLSHDVRDGVIESGGRPARYDCTDLCDGIIQGTSAMDYSLPSREVMTMAVEMHARGGHFDGLVLVSGSDKAVPAHLLAAARLDMPAILVPGGVMEPGPSGTTLPHENMTLEQVGTIYAQLRRGLISPHEYEFLRQEACPTKGGCAFMGTSGTMQVMAEALGLAPLGSALRPANSFSMTRGCRQAG